MKELELTAGFFNAVMQNGEPDRVYNASDLNEHLKGLTKDKGIYDISYNGTKTSLKVEPSSGMDIVVRAGRGKIDNHWFNLENDVILTLDNADGTTNRTDSVVVTLYPDDRCIKLEILNKDNAYSNSINSLVLADINVSAGTTQVISSNITDVRDNTTYCGWIMRLDQYDKIFDVKLAQVDSIISGNKLKYVFDCSVYDSTKYDSASEAISQMALDFLNAEGDFEYVDDYENLEIDVVGYVSWHSQQSLFEINSTVSSNRTVVLDFSNASGLFVNPEMGDGNIACAFDIGNNVTIKNASIAIITPNAKTIYGFHGGVIKDCKLIIYDQSTNETIYGAYACKEVSNSNIRITAASNASVIYGAYACDKVSNNKIYEIGSSSVETMYGTYSCKRVQDNDIFTGEGYSMYVDNLQIATGNRCRWSYQSVDGSLVVNNLIDETYNGD